MKEKSVKLLKTQSLLKEVVSEAFGILGDEDLRGLCVTDVDCSKGKYSAKVYLDPMYFNTDEQKYILQKLKKAKGIIQNFCLNSEGWYRTPLWSFYFDDTLEKQNKIDALFKEIAKTTQK